jgi:hypothetical protein
MLRPGDGLGEFSYKFDTLIFGKLGRWELRADLFNFVMQEFLGFTIGIPNSSAKFNKKNIPVIAEGIHSKAVTKTFTALNMIPLKY